jgi:hypothetical protein
MSKIPNRVLEISERLRAGDQPRRFKVRAILKWFGAMRRGSNVVSEIQNALAAFGLETDPRLDQAGIDDVVRYRIANSAMGDENRTALPIVAGPDPHLEELSHANSADASTSAFEVHAVPIPTEDHLEPEHDEDQFALRLEHFHLA